MRRLRARVSRLEERFPREDPYHGVLFHDGRSLLDRSGNVLAPLAEVCPEAERYSAFTFYKSIPFQGRLYAALPVDLWAGSEPPDLPRKPGSGDEYS